MAKLEYDTLVQTHRMSVDERSHRILIIRGDVQRSGGHRGQGISGELSTFTGNCYSFEREIVQAWLAEGNHLVSVFVDVKVISWKSKDVKVILERVFGRNLRQCRCSPMTIGREQVDSARSTLAWVEGQPQTMRWHKTCLSR